MQVQLETKQKVDSVVKVTVGLMMISLAMMAAGFLASGIDSTNKLLNKQNEQLISAEVTFQTVVFE
jgi:hypothetical protein